MQVTTDDLQFSSNSDEGQDATEIKSTTFTNLGCVFASTFYNGTIELNRKIFTRKFNWGGFVEFCIELICWRQNTTGQSSKGKVNRWIFCSIRLEQKYSTIYWIENWNSRENIYWAQLDEYIFTRKRTPTRHLWPRQIKKILSFNY